MCTYNIQITEPAEDDLYEIAKKVTSKIAKGINSLEDMPLRNALVYIYYSFLYIIT